MITISKRNLISLSLAICWLCSFSACNEEVTGCLDITAANYNAAADNDCPESDESSTCECTYNQLNLDLDFIVDTLDFALNRTFVNSIGDSVNIREAHLIFSNFEIFNNTASSYTIQNFSDFDGDGSSDEINDIIVSDFTNSNTDVGDVIVRDTIQEVSFGTGLIPAYNNAALNFESNEMVQEIIDSNYIDVNNQLAFFRMRLFDINVDTTEYTFEYYAASQMFEMTFPLDTVVNYDDNIDLELDLDMNILFLDVDISESSASELLIDNLKSSIIKRE